MPAKKAAGDAAAKPAAAPAKAAESKPAAEKKQGGAQPPKTQPQGKPQGQVQAQAGGHQASPSNDRARAQPQDSHEAGLQRKIDDLDAKIKKYKTDLDKISKDLDAEKGVRDALKEERAALNAEYNEVGNKIAGDKAQRVAVIDKLKELKRVRQLKRDEANRIKAKLVRPPPADESPASQETYLKKLEDEIRQFERNLAGKAVSLQDEKKRVEEISALRQAKNIYKDYVAVYEKINQDNKAIKEIEAELDKGKEVNPSSAEEGKNRKAKRDEVNKKQDESRLRTEGLINKREETRDNMTKAREEWGVAKDALTEYKKKRYEQQKVQRDKERERWAAEKAEREARYKAKQEERKKLEDEKVPYQDELYYCDALVKYLEPLAPAKPKEETAAAATTAAPAALEGNVTILKKEDEESDFKKKNKRERKPVKITQDLKHNVDVFLQFETISLAAPATLADVENSIKEVKAKKEHFQKLSEAGLKEREAKRAAAAAAAAEAEAKPAAESAPTTEAPAADVVASE